MTNKKLKQKLCDLIIKNSDSDFSDYSNISDAVENIFLPYKNFPKNPLQKSHLTGLIFGKFDDIITSVERNWDVPIEPFTNDEEEELEDIILQLRSFITRKYDL